MEGAGRSWQRGNSKNARGASNSRQLSQPTDKDIDPMMSSVQKSHIASILQGARSTVGGNSELQRPFTPGDLPRHLFSGDDYQNRPGSSYKMKNIVGQAIDEFQSAVGNQSVTTSASIPSSALSSKHPRAGSQNKDKNVMSMISKIEMTKKPRGNVLPALEPIKKDSLSKIGLLPAINKQTIKAFESNKPIKVLQQDCVNEQSLIIQGQSQTQKPIKVKKSSQPKSNQQQTLGQEISKKEDYQEFMSEDAKFDEMMKFDQSKMENMIKIQELQSQIKKANKKRNDQEKLQIANDIDEEEKDQYEDYFETQMEKDMLGVESYQQPIDYEQVLEQIQNKVSLLDQSRINQEYEDYDDEYLNKSIAQSEDQIGGYVAEYQEVINEMSKICSVISFNNKTEDKSLKIAIKEIDIIELCPRIYTLATEHDKQHQQIREQCFLETLLKGSFSLLSIKFPRAVLRLSSCNIHLFLKIFERYSHSQLMETVIAHQQDFVKLYNYLFETMKILLLYAKEGAHDEMFKQEGLIPQIARVIQTCFLDQSHLIIKLTSQVVNRKEIINDDLVYDLVNYTIGSIKCFTQSSKEVQNESVKQHYILILAKSLRKAMGFGSNMSKKAQMLVQICGSLRNLANDENSYQQFITNGLIQGLVEVLEQYKGHKELMLNVSRILSKMSTDTDCCLSLIQTKRLSFMLDLLSEFQSFTPFLVRIAFVLANITSYFEEAREQLYNNDKSLQKLLNVIILYFEKDQSGTTITDGTRKQKKGEESSPSLGNIEDSLVKMIRLIANLCTDERFTMKHLMSNQLLINQMVEHIVNAIQRKNLAQNEEFIFNAISCATNLLFYDTPQSQLFTLNLREQLFNVFKNFMLVTNNDELQIEAVRVLSNLSRHRELCELFVSDKAFLEALTVTLDHTLRDLVFYSIGIVINITLHESSRPKVLEKGVIGKLVNVLKDSNIEDMELAKVSAKALHNISGENAYWTIELIKKLDDILSSLGEELDSIMEVANEEELVEIKGLREMVNALINDMPEPMFNCPDAVCGRKFKNKEELEKHLERRHGGNKQ